MFATVTFTAENALLGNSESGHQVPMDMAPDLGGQNQGPRPKVMILPVSYTNLTLPTNYTM